MNVGENGWENLDKYWFNFSDYFKFMKLLLKTIFLIKNYLK
jgi:hypothetical protein